MFDNVDIYLYPVQVEQSSGIEVTYFWEIKVSDINGEIYVSAEEKSFGINIPWVKSEEPNKERAVFALSGICHNRSK
ncbi:hypothetical protein JOD29_000831 [Lysinibacillus composti]|uniref:Uncharacterized protein n=1 Tax=Lysinibacillus composti TaxID=720633 RepID=A0A3N9UKT4_9BACI|nr:hypothetical protein [Lysinibacillus composti]MBM7607587.1 hypothetical protein [Lysinibacillus composti]RQW75908.1 hypothetical protein EBB45_04640 [Lysinibacillus composti]